MRGKVVSLEPSGHVAVVNGEEIKGWMAAMTMEYPVKDQQEFQKLKPGEEIQATVFVQGDQYWLGEIKEAPASAPTTPPPTVK